MARKAGSLERGCPLCRLLRFLRAIHTRRVHALKQIEKQAQPRPFYRERLQLEGERWMPDVRWYRRRNS
jgi:hypothetical protein